MELKHASKTFGALAIAALAVIGLTSVFSGNSEEVMYIVSSQDMKVFLKVPHSALMANTTIHHLSLEQEADRYMLRPKGIEFSKPIELTMYAPEAAEVLIYRQADSYTLSPPPIQDDGRIIVMVDGFTGVSIR